MPTKFMFKRPYRVSIPAHSLWLYGQIDLESDVYLRFTDESLTGGTAGTLLGFAIPHHF